MNFSLVTVPLHSLFSPYFNQPRNTACKRRLRMGMPFVCLSKLENFGVCHPCTSRRLLNCCSAPRLCPTLCDPMHYSTPGFPVHHHLLELALTHAHWVSDTLQPFHPLSPPSPPAFNLSQHQGLFQWFFTMIHVGRDLHIVLYLIVWI